MKRPRQQHPNSLANLRPMPGLPHDHRSAVFRVSGPRDALRWWESLTPAQRGEQLEALRRAQR